MSGELPDNDGAQPSDFDRLGGAVGLRAIIDDFTATVFDDVMIGFLFDGKNHRRINAMEYRFAANHLGGAVEYTGRSIEEAHRRSPIMGGHFMRRRQILADTLAAHDAPADVVEHWLAHVDSLSPDVLGSSTAQASECNHDRQKERLKAAEGSDGAPDNDIGAQEPVKKRGSLRTLNVLDG